MTTISVKPPELHKHSVSPSTDSAFNAPLGNLANISSTPEKFEISAAQSNKNRRFLLLDNARRILRNHNVTNRTGKSHRTRNCLAVRFDKTEDIGILLNDSETDSAAGLSNLVTCGSICSCPVCAHKIMLEKAQDIKKALIYSKDNGLVPLMLTLTAQHHKSGKLADFLAQFKTAWRYFASGREWRTFKDTYGIYYSVSAREVTRMRTNADNGWHYHMHILLFLDPKNILHNDEFENMQARFTTRWMNALERNGLTGIPEIACNLKAGEHVGEHYLTKLGLTQDDKGKLEYELTGNEYKGSTIWDILDAAAWGDVEAEYQYLEYVEVMTGENWITFSHGFKDLFKDIEVPETQEQSESRTMSLWYWIPQETWNLIVRNHAVHRILHIAARYRDRQKIIEFIEGLEHERRREISNRNDVH